MTFMRSLARSSVLLAVCSLCVVSVHAQEDDDVSHNNKLNQLFKKKEKEFNARERVMHAKNNAYADKWRTMMKKVKAKENKDIPFKVDPHSNILLENHPSDQCTEGDVFNFCTGGMREELSQWYNKDTADGRFEVLPLVGFSPACYPWLKRDAATRCVAPKQEAAFWLSEAISRDERFGKLTELLYECYRCVQKHVPQLHLKPALDVACATPRKGEVDRCEHRCAEKLAEKYKVPVLTKLCWRSESDFQGFGRHNYRINACKEFNEEKKSLRKHGKKYEMSYEMEMDVCSCFKTCKRPMITCTSDKYSLADMQIADANSGVCCASAEELAQHVGVAILPEHDILYGGHVFDYNSYIQTKVCSWDGQLDTKVCKKRKASGWKSTQNFCGRYTTRSPTHHPTPYPTRAPTHRPTTSHPTRHPTRKPTMEPTQLSGHAFEMAMWLKKHASRFQVPTPAPTPCKKFDDDYDDGTDDGKNGCANKT